MAATQVRAALALLAATCLAGCRGCGAHVGGGAPSASSRPPPAPLPTLAIGSTPAITAPTFPKHARAPGVALPAGCSVDLPVRFAPLPAAATTRFIGARAALDALVMAESGEAGAITARGAVDLATGKVDARVPWTDPGAPPLFDRASSGWVAALSQPGALERAVLWRQGATPGELARGDQLRVADLACSGARCAVLTSLARASVLPGATLVIGDVATDPARWKHVDIEAGSDAAWGPLALPAFDQPEGTAWVALATNTQVALWRVEGGHASRRRTDVTPHGAYDAVATRTEPIVIAPGAPRDTPCSGKGFPLVFVGAGSKPHELSLVAPPTGLIARPLARGALVAWIGPPNCRVPEPTVVHAVILDDDGTPLSPPMAVTPGAGFALATSGDRLSLWIRTDDGLVWLQGRCNVTPPD